MFDAPSDEERQARASRALRQATVFRDLDEDTLARVARLARPLALPHGASVDESPAAVGSIYLIAEGRLRLYREAPTGRQVTLDLLGAGEAFRFLGREADGTPVSVAEVVTPQAGLYRFPGPLLLEALAARPDAALRLVAELSRALTRLYDDKAELGLYDTETRLARLLVRLATEDPEGMSYVGATHEELAWRVVATRENVTRYVRHFAHLGLIVTEEHRHGIVVRADLDTYARHLASRRRGEPHADAPWPSPS